MFLSLKLHSPYSRRIRRSGKMLRGHDNRVALRGRIVGMHESGKTASEISRELGVTKDTVYLWIRRWQEEGTLADRRRQGRPRETTDDQDEAIKEAAERNSFTNAVAVAQDLNLPVSERTVRRRLHEQGIHHRRPAVKEKLTERHRELRLQFARNHEDQGMEFWARAVFSDEKTFRSSNHGKIHCWRYNNTRYERRNIFEEARSGHVTCNLWGWMSINGVGELTPINGRFTSEQYIEILEEVMLPSVRAYAFPYPERFLFIQDRCPIHTSGIVQRWFREHPEIELMDWPSKGCDMNPIENLWGNLVNTWEPSEERTSHALFEHAIREWEILRRKPHLVRQHVESMPRRLQQVIEKEGGWTKY